MTLFSVLFIQPRSLSRFVLSLFSFFFFYFECCVRCDLIAVSLFFSSLLPLAAYIFPVLSTYSPVVGGERQVRNLRNKNLLPIGASESWNTCSAVPVFFRFFLRRKKEIPKTKFKCWYTKSQRRRKKEKNLCALWNSLKCVTRPETVGLFVPPLKTDQERKTRGFLSSFLLQFFFNFAFLQLTFALWREDDQKTDPSDNQNRGKTGYNGGIFFFLFFLLHVVIHFPATTETFFFFLFSSCTSFFEKSFFLAISD